MAAGLVLVPIKDANGVSRNAVFWSSDGTITGDLRPVQALAPYQASALGYQQLTPLSAAAALTVPTGATFAVISAEAGDARWRDDGSAPTGTVGMPIYAGSPPQTFAGDLGALQFIQVSAASIINVSYYK